MITAAEPSQSESPIEAMQAAYISVIRSSWVIAPVLTRSMTLRATNRPMMPENPIDVCHGSLVIAARRPTEPVMSNRRAFQASECNSFGPS